MRPVHWLVITLLTGLVFAGCGGSEDPPPAVEPAADRSDQIAKLRQEARQLKRKLKRQRARRAAARSREEASGGANGSLESVLAGLPGQAGLVAGAPGTGGPTVVGGDFTTGDAWSTIKVSIAERVLRDFGGPDGISPAQRANITAAITVSDNDAAAALFRDLENRHGGLAAASGAVGEMLREAGDAETVISTQGRDSFSTYGQTDWSLENQYRYMAALAGGCISDPASREFLLGQMGSVGGSDLFGIGATGVPARWKGGWGPGTDGKYLVRQMGVVEADGKEIVLAIAAIPDDGTFESGQSMLSELAGWAATELAGQIPAPGGC